MKASAEASVGWAGMAIRSGGEVEAGDGVRTRDIQLGNDTVPRKALALVYCTSASMHRDR